MSGSQRPDAGLRCHSCDSSRPSLPLCLDDAGRLCGVVSRGDLLQVFLRPDEDIEEEVRRTVVSYLFPLHAHAIRVSVRDGIVVLSGPVHDTSLIWVAERLVRGLEGVVGVESRLRAEGPDPDAPHPAE